MPDGYVPDGFVPEDGRRQDSHPTDVKLDAQVVAELYLDHAAPLQRFLVGLLRDSQLAHDVLQATFAKALEHGHTTQAETRKAWLFRVAYNEAMALRRRQGVDGRAMERVAWSRDTSTKGADEPAIRYETVAAVRQAIDELPAAQQQIVRMRIYEEKTFAVIAEELQIPLGTALARMRAAMEKLSRSLRDEN